MSPARNPAVADVEDEGDHDQDEREEQMMIIAARQMLHGLEDGGGTAHAVGNGEEIRQVKAADHRKVFASGQLGHAQPRARRPAQAKVGSRPPSPGSRGAFSSASAVTGWVWR